MELGSTVTLIYTGKLEDGTVFGYATAEQPMKFQTGMDMVIDGLEEAILQMNEAGEKKTVVVDQYKAYGEYLDDFYQIIPREQIPVSNIAVGKRIWMSDDNGSTYPATVVEVTNENVKFDMNHPLAGKDLIFDIEILEIEEPPANFVDIQTKKEHLEQQSKLLGGEQADTFR